MPTSSAPRRSGVLIIRAWIEDQSGEFRAHVTAQLDIDSGAKEEFGAEDPAALVRIVGHWADRFAQSAPGGGTPGSAS